MVKVSVLRASTKGRYNCDMSETKPDEALNTLPGAAAMTTPPGAPAESSSVPTGTSTPDENEMKRALAAFRKRLKLSQLEQDSKLGRSFTTGQRETITAIKPPLGFGKEIWQQLADRGDLKYDGGGFYALPKK